MWVVYEASTFSVAPAVALLASSTTLGPLGKEDGQLLLQVVGELASGKETDANKWGHMCR